MAFRQIPIVNLQEGQTVESVYLVRRRQLATAKTGRPYINLTLADKTGEVTARVFNNVEHFESLFIEGDFINVQARVQIYDQKTQLLVDALERVRPEDIDPMDFLPSSPRDPQVLLSHLRGLLETISDEKIRRLCLSALDGEIGARFLRAPAAQSMHHSYIGGLLEHTVSLMMLLELASQHYRNVNRDILLAGGLFHDIGKIDELAYDRAIAYSNHGRLVPHLVIGVEIVDRLAEPIEGFSEDAKLQIQHIILSHHGTREFGSPVLPATVEAAIVHHMDDMDAKVFAYLNHVEKAGTEVEWTERHYLLGTHIKRTTDAEGTLYSYRLPGEADAEFAGKPSGAGRKSHKKPHAKEPESTSKQFDLLGKK